MTDKELKQTYIDFFDGKLVSYDGIFYVLNVLEITDDEKRSLDTEIYTASRIDRVLAFDLIDLNLKKIRYYWHVQEDNMLLYKSILKVIS